MPSQPTRGTAGVIHLELHTRDALGAARFYQQLCGWRSEAVPTPAGSYHALGMGDGPGGGIVGCEAPRALWLPYVRVDGVEEATARAQALGARVLLAPREGPAGWRSVVATPSAGELALWQPRR